jgi:hypothetical protein
MAIRQQEHLSTAEYRRLMGLDLPEHLPLAAKDPRAPLQALARMNKTEAAYDRHLRTQKLAGVGIRTWYYEPCRFRLPASKGKVNTFCPDFLVVYEDGSQEWVEIKRAWAIGRSRTQFRPGYVGDARVKLVTFAGAYPELRVVMRWLHPYHQVWEEEVFNG